MREVAQRRRAETVVRQGASVPKPQWRNLFQAPVYPAGTFDEVEELVPDRPAVPRRRRSGRRIK